jgi:polyhydroxyalkanoate synthase
MESPVNSNDADLSHTDAAPQRRRGPHPLPVFLDHLTRATAGDPAALRRALAGLRRYQSAPRSPPRPLRPVVAQSGHVTLRDYGAALHNDRSMAPAIIVVPSLINPPTVLDLAEGNSLLQALAGAGIRPLLVDWGATDPRGLEAMVAERLVPLLRQWEAPVALAGYCLGGTLAMAAAALLPAQVTRLALLAAPWHFSAYGAARHGLADWWRDAEPLAVALGSVPMDLLQPAFWSLDPAGLATKYGRFAEMPDGPEATAFTTLEDWSNTGQPLSLAAARGLAETLFRDDATGNGQWTINGCRIDPAALTIPILDIIAERDRIVPPAAALSASGPGTPLRLDAGHVGMVVGGRAPDLLWRPLIEWLHPA